MIPSPRVAILLLAATVSACQSAPARPKVSDSKVSSARAVSAEAWVDARIEDSKRLADAQYVLSFASSKQCGDFARPQSGMLLSHVGFYPNSALRESMREDHSMQRELGVVHLVPGGTAERAGIRLGDRLVGVDDKRLKTSDEFFDHLLELTDRSTVELTLARGSEEITLSVPLPRGCPFLFRPAEARFSLTTLRPQRLIVAVPIGMLRSLDDDQLGIALAHEVAHLLIDDPERSRMEREARADRFGLRLAHAAGFDIRKAVAYWERVAQSQPGLIDARQAWAQGKAKSHKHVGIAQRLAAIRATVAELRGDAAGGN